MSLYDPNTKPWFRKCVFSTERYETSLLSDTSELLYYRFLLSYIEHRCRLPSEPRILAKVLSATPRQVSTFLAEASSFITRDDAGMLVHKYSTAEFDKALQTSIRQAKNRRGRAGQCAE
jgi:hypothetical protein